MNWLLHLNLIGCSKYFKSNIIIRCQCLFDRNVQYWIQTSQWQVCIRIKVKTSTFDTKLMNNRKIRMLTTIDPFWEMSVYLSTQCFEQRSDEIFLKLFPQIIKKSMAINDMSQSLWKPINWIISNWICVLEITIF